MEATHAILKNGERITIRPKSPDDAEALAGLFDVCSERTYHYFHPYPLNRESAERVAQDESIFCLFAVDAEERILGYVWIDRDGDLPVLGLCVGDPWHGRGIGRLLLTTILDESKRRGKDGIQLTVMKENARAIALYESLGFVIDGEADDPVGPSHHMTCRFDSTRSAVES